MGSLPVTKLEIGSNDYKDGGIVSLLNQLRKKKLRNLMHISIFSALCHDETDALCEVLKDSDDTEDLNINIKHTQSSSTILLASTINSCTNLVNLFLYYTGTPECAQSFVSTLHPSVLTWWHLNFKRLDSQRIQGNELQCLHSN